MEYLMEDPNVVYEFDENGNPRVPNDSQSLIEPAIPPEAPVPLITNRPERRQEARDTRGGFIDDEVGPISYKDSPTGKILSEPAISRASPIGTNQEELRQAAIDTGGAFLENGGKVTSYRKEPPKPTVEQQLTKIENLTPEQLTKVFEGKYNVSLTKSAEEQAVEQTRSEMPARFRKQNGFDISRATDAQLSTFMAETDKIHKGRVKIFEERQKLAIDAMKEFSSDNIKKLREENRQLDLLLKTTKPPAPKNVPFMDDKGRVIMINENDPNSQAVIDKNGLVPYSKPAAPAKPEKPEKPKEITTLDLKRLGDMINKATNDGKEDPAPNDRLLIEQAAAKAGYSFVNTKGSKPGVLWGTNPTNTWDLVPKEQATTFTMPTGAKPGTYKGVRAYTTDGKTFYDMSGKRLD